VRCISLQCSYDGIKPFLGNNIIAGFDSAQPARDCALSEVVACLPQGRVQYRGGTISSRNHLERIIYEPVSESSRITVQYIVNEIKAGVTPEEIVTDKPHLTLASVYSALAYYYANKDGLDANFSTYNLDCQDLEMSIQS
jgi:uncharacterized protein (DUF433 family)